MTDVSRRSVLAGLFGVAASPAMARMAPDMPNAVHSRYAGYRQAHKAAHAEQAQFLLMYDTHHQNRGMATYPLEKEALDIAQKNGVKNIFLEFPREFQPAIDGRANGTMSHDYFMGVADEDFHMFEPKMAEDVQPDDTVLETTEAGDFSLSIVDDVKGRKAYLERLSQGIVDAKARGIRVIGADSEMISGEKRLDRDAQVAGYIAAYAQGEKSVITYGVFHGSLAKPGNSVIPGGGLDDELRRYGGVMTVEMRDTLPEVTATDKFVKATSASLMSGLQDKAPYTLNIETGAFAQRKAPGFLSRTIRIFNPGGRP